jgi:hypothetical protein
MAAFLQQTPYLHFTIGLVELGIYRETAGEDSPLYVQPMIVGRTREVTRAVVELKMPVRRDDIQVTFPEKPPPPGRHKMTEEEFLEQRSRTEGSEVTAFAREVLDEAQDHGLTIAPMDAGPCLRYVDEESGTFFTLGQLNRNGRLTSTDRLSERVMKEGMSDEIYQSYLEEIASFVPGAARKSFKSASGRRQWKQLVYGEKPTPSSELPLVVLATHEDEWFGAIDRVVAKIRASRSTTRQDARG